MLWIAVVLFSIVGTLLVTINRHLMQFEAEASLYPMQMRCDEAMASVNPCFKAKRILESTGFREVVIERVSVDELTPKTYDYHVRVYETSDHQLSLHSYFSDSATARSVLTIMVETLNAMYDESVSTFIECNTDYHEALVEDYIRYSEDAAPDEFVCMDVVDEPRIIGKPSGSRILLYLCLSSLFVTMVAGFSIVLWRKLRNPSI